MTPSLKTHTRAIPIISTAHIPHYTAQKLSRLDGDVSLRLDDSLWAVLPYEPLCEGWVVFINDAEQVEQVRAAGHPELADLMLVALGQGFTRLELEAAGDVVEGLPTFDW